MRDLGSNLFYKTKFDIKSVSDRDDYDLHWIVVMKIFIWMKDKHSKTMDFETDIRVWSRFKDGKESITCSNGRESVDMYSIIHYVNDGDCNKRIWACKVRESFSSNDGRAPRTWITEIGYDGDFRKAEISVIVYYSDQAGFIGPCEDEPQPTIPRIIGMILGDSNILCTRSGYNIGTRAKPVEVGDFSSFWKMISDSGRDVPVIYISRSRKAEGAELLIDPYRLAGELGPSAIVCFAPSCEANEGIASQPKFRRFRCTNGALRVYAPHPNFEDADEPYRHRFIKPGEIISADEDYVYRVLRRALAQDVSSYDEMTRMDQVARLNRDSSADRRVHFAKDAGFDEAVAMMEDDDKAKAKEIEILKAENVYLADGWAKSDDKVKELESTVRLSNSKISSIMSRLNDKMESDEINPTSDGLSEILGGAKLPLNSIEIGRLFTLAFPNKIDFSENGWESLKNCRTGCNTLWNALRDMCTILHNLYIEDDAGNIVDKFNSSSTFELALSSSGATRDNKALMRNYHEQYKGRTLNFEPHVKSTNGKASDQTFLRLYYAYDHESGKIIIGKCEHAETAGTRR